MSCWRSCRRSVGATGDVNRVAGRRHSDVERIGHKFNGEPYLLPTAKIAVPGIYQGNERGATHTLASGHQEDKLPMSDVEAQAIEGAALAHLRFVPWTQCWDG